MSLKQSKEQWRKRIDDFILRSNLPFSVKECSKFCGGMPASVRKELNKRVEQGQLYKSDVLTGIMRYWAVKGECERD